MTSRRLLFFGITGALVFLAVTFLALRAGRPQAPEPRGVPLQPLPDNKPLPANEEATRCFLRTRAAFLAGEPGATVEETRRRLEGVWTQWPGSMAAARGRIFDLETLSRFPEARRRADQGAGDSPDGSANRREALEAGWLAAEGADPAGPPDSSTIRGRGSPGFDAEECLPPKSRRGAATSSKSGTTPAIPRPLSVRRKAFLESALSFPITYFSMELQAASLAVARRQIEALAKGGHEREAWETCLALRWKAPRLNTIAAPCRELGGKLAPESWSWSWPGTAFGLDAILTRYRENPYDPRVLANLAFEIQKAGWTDLASRLQDELLELDPKEATALDERLSKLSPPDYPGFPLFD